MVGQTILHYRVLRTLGSGGMGVVYEAQDLRLGRLVALKFLPPDLDGDPAAVERFQREARAASALNHPNICTIYAIEQATSAERRRHFIAMEALEGQSLDRRLAGQPLPLDLTLELGIQIADALDAAHTRGIVHRDIKPANIFVLSGRQAKVLDFGLAKLAETRLAMAETMTAGPIEALTSPGTAVGTVAYMSPEQARGEALDARTDLFSFGAVLYEMSTGRAPFGGKTSAVIFQQILDKAPEAPRALNPSVPPKLEEIVVKALEKDRDLRFQTAAELRGDLKRLKRDTSARRGVTASPAESVQPSAVAIASPASSGAILAAEAKRHKLGLGVAAAVLLLLASTAAFGVYSLLRREAPAPQSVPGQQMAITQLTTTGNVVGCVSISPDGRHVVYCTTDGTLWVRQVATGATVRLAERSIGPVAFSPDGDFVYLTQGALYLLPALGGERRRVVSPVVAGPAAPSPDGQQIAFMRPNIAAGEVALMIANRDGSGERPLHTGRVAEGWVTNFGPSWSPDGTLIAAPYWSREDGFLQVPVVIDVETGLLRRLTDQRWFQVFRTAWLHDGSGLIFTATAIGETHVQLWHVSYPAGQVRRVTNDLDRYGRTSLGISDDDNVVATGQFKDDGDVWIMDAAGGNGTRLTSGSGSDVVLGWTGNQGLIYYSNLPARSLWMVAADGGAPRRVATDLMFVGPGVSVSPRQDWIAYVAPSEDGVNLWRANLDGSDRVQLTHGGAGHLPVITPDGESVLYIRYEHGRPSVWKVPAGGGEPVQVIGNDAVVLVGAAAQLSPDGQRILTFVRDEQANRRRMAIFSASDGSLEQMLADEPLDAPAQLPRWSPDSRSVVFVRTQGRVSNLWTQSLDGSAPRQITQFETDIIFGFAYSPDGRQLALSRGPVTGEVVLIRNFR